jgi:hypothetical protein
MKKGWIILCFLFVFSISSVSAAVFDGLIAYWEFEGTTGPVMDSITGFHNGTNNGALRGQPGKIGNSFEYDGINDFVRVEHHPDFNFDSNDFTIGGWYNTDNILTNGGAFGKYFDPDPGNAEQISIYFGNSPNKISFELREQSSPNILVHSFSDFNSNTWYHVVLVIDQPDEARLYVNNVLEGIADISSVQDLNIPEHISFGRPYHVGSPPYFDGLIDELGIWDRALSESEISQLYNNGNGLFFGSPPVLDPVGSYFIEENETLIIQLSASDPENDTLTFGTNAGSVLPSPFFFDEVTGLFEWTPTFNNAGDYFVTFSVSDGYLSDEEIAFISVNDVEILECPWDFNGDELVGIVDLLTLLSNWGMCPVGGESAQEYNQPLPELSPEAKEILREYLGEQICEDKPNVRGISS